MTRYRTGVRLLRAVLLSTAAVLASGCTLFDDYMPGTPFTPDQPKAEVTVQGEINIDRSGGGDDCPPGGTIFWGIARNSGDVNVDDVSITISAYNAAGDLIGSFRDHVYNGDIEESETGSSATAETNLEVDQSGSFQVCTTVSFDSVARAEYQTDFIVIEDFGSTQ